MKLQEQGISVSEEQEREILRRVKEFGTTQKTILNKEQFTKIVNEVLS